MNKPELLAYFERMDQALTQPTTLCVYGAAAFILLDQPDRTSIDVDVAGPYSQADFVDLRQAAEQAGLPINPSEEIGSDHIEWISALRLCLPKPRPDEVIRLWQGRQLTIHTVSPPDLVASKLIRYDSIDQSDIQYLCSQRLIEFPAIQASVKRLPPPFNEDAVVRQNLENLKTDLAVWRGDLS